MFNCEICGSEFTTKGNLKNHKNNVHEKPDAFQCILCNKTFPNKNYFVEHDEIFHKNKKDEFKCETCGNGYNTKKNLKRHIMRNHEVPKYKCDLCGRTYKDKSYLNIHLKAHSKAKIECESCDKVFTSKVALKQHVKNVHNDLNSVGDIEKAKRQSKSEQSEILEGI